ncbi:hypothetical protein BH20ACT22_BH20ACT22_11160 [soil metagenome]
MTRLAVLDRSPAGGVRNRMPHPPLVQKLDGAGVRGHPSRLGLLDNRLPEHAVLEAVVVGELSVVPVCVAGEPHWNLVRPKAPVALLPLQKPIAGDMRADSGGVVAV